MNTTTYFGGEIKKKISTFFCLTKKASYLELSNWGLPGGENNHVTNMNIKDLDQPALSGRIFFLLLKFYKIQLFYRWPAETDQIERTGLGLWGLTACWVQIAVKNILKYFFLLFPENRLCYFMQIVSLGDNLHEITNPIFWGKK